MFNCAPNKTSTEDKLTMVSLYNNGISAVEISEKFKISKNSVYGNLRRRGVKIRPQTECQRKYSLNERYFDIIDDQYKAYFLGFLYADGCNYVKRNNIQITLQERDAYILEKFSNLIGSNKPLLYYIGKGNRVNYYRMDLISKHLSEQLVTLGCVGAKTFKLKFPDFLDKNLIHHFVRGYFDGDGTVGIGKKPSPSQNKYIGAWAGLTSTNSFCKGLRYVTEDVLGVSGSLIINHPEDNDIITRFSLNGKKQIIKFLGWLYEDSDIHLERKHSIYLKLLSQYI